MVPAVRTFNSYPATGSGQVTSAPGTLYSFRAENRAASVVYLQLWDTASGPGTGTLLDSIGIPQTSTYKEDAVFYEAGRSFASGLCFAFSTTVTAYTAATAANCTFACNTST